MIPVSIFRATLAAIGASFVLPAFAQESETALPAASVAAAPLPAGETVSIPLAGGGMFGGNLAMVTQVFRPPGDGPFPVVVFSHGRAPDAADRAHVKIGISNAQLRFWLARGDAVVSPIRPGYGATGGGDPENNGAHFDAFGRCTRRRTIAGRRPPRCAPWTRRSRGFARSHGRTRTTCCWSGSRWAA